MTEHARARRLDVSAPVVYTDCQTRFFWRLAVMKLSPRLAAFAAAYTDALHARSKNPTPPELPASPDFLRPNTNYAQSSLLEK